MTSIETVILKCLTTNIDYTRAVVPFLKKDYFADKAEQAVYLIADSYFQKYNACAPSEVLRIEVDKLKDLNENVYRQTLSVIDKLEGEKITSEHKWLIDNTESFIKERSLHIGLQKAIEIYNGSDKKLTSTAIPSILSEALSVGFDTKTGHDYVRDVEDQIDYYHSDIVRIPFDVEIFNAVTNGGVPRKTLTSLVAGTHVGKSLTMCSLAGGMFLRGANVLYISLEESEEEIRKRIDANILDFSMDQLLKIDKRLYKKKFGFVTAKSVGTLKIKGFATASAGASHFRYLLNEYRIKENFVPDVIFIDYLNICISDRFKNVDNSNTHLKSVAEELRGLTSENNCAIITAAQLNRGGFKSSNPDMGDVADSFASLFVCDCVWVLTAPDELRVKNMMQIRQEKNRYKNMNFKRRFIVGTDPYRMRVFDLEEAPEIPPDIDTPDEINTTRSYDLIDPETGEVLEEGLSAAKAAKFKEFVFTTDEEE